MRNKINNNLYDFLLNQHKRTATVNSYERSKDWVEGHLKRLCTKFGWLAIGGLVKHTIADTTRVSKVEKFIVSEHGILVDVGFGNIWYYECKRPAKEEVKKFDGHCLLLAD